MTFTAQEYAAAGGADTLLIESASRLFAAHPTTQAAMEDGRFPAAAWAAIVDSGLHRALLPGHAGGFGLASNEAMGLLRIAGECLSHVPLAETMLAGWLLASAGLEVPDAPLTAAPVLPLDTMTLQRATTGWRLTGIAHRIPWGRHATTIAVTALFEGVSHIARVSSGQWRCVPGTNIALEPRDTIEFDAFLQADDVAPGPAFAQLESLGAAMRSLQIAGALARLLRMTIGYAQDRSQFGCPIGKQQVIQQYLATLAGQAVAAAAAADIAAEAVGKQVDPQGVAVAKARTSEAIGQAAAIAHQVHGAMGFTYEHELHLVTKRLWSWREEFGNELVWQRRLGRFLAALGPEGLWPGITALGREA